MTGLFLFAAMTPISSAAASTKSAGPLWNDVYVQSETFFRGGHFKEAIGPANQAWKLAKKQFGQEDIRTYASELLLLSSKAYQKQASGGKAEKLLTRIAALQEKAVVRRRMTFDMEWRYGDPSKEWPNSKRVILTFAEYPKHHIVIYSPDLGAHLESLPGKRVPVTFEATYDAMGKMREYKTLQIGDLAHWRSDWEYGGSSGDYVPSPWKDGPGEIAQR